MMTRILKILGRNPALRRERLQRVEGWMASRGWRLADYSEEAGSALFERGEDGPPLGWLDGTRWLPGPGALAPRQWLATLRADPRLGIAPGGALVLLLLLAMALFGPSRLNLKTLQHEQAARNWFVVTTRQLNVRDGPDTSHQQVGVLYKGQRVKVEGAVNNTWVRISIPTQGYVAKTYLAPAPPPEEKE